MLKNHFLKFLIKLAFILSILIAIDFILGAIFGNMLKNQTDGRFYKIAYSLDKSKEDIIIIGSSRAETNYNPKLIGKELNMSCWNSGRGGQGIIFFTCIAEEIMKRFSPKIILLNMDPNGLEDPLDYDRLSILRPFAKNHTEIKKYLNRQDSFEKYKLMSNIYSYNSMMFYFLRPYFVKNKDGNSSDMGWKPREGEISETLLSQNKPGTNPGQKEYLNMDAIDYLNLIIETAKKKHVNLIISISPNFYPPQKETATISYVKNLCKEKRINLINFTNDTSLVEKKKYFVDLYHLNEVGANVFSKLLSKKLIEVHVNPNNAIN